MAKFLDAMIVQNRGFTRASDDPVLLGGNCDHNVHPCETSNKIKEKVLVLSLDLRLILTTVQFYTADRWKYTV